MISTIINIGLTYIGSSLLVAIVCFAIALWEVGYAENGVIGAIRQLGTLFFGGIGIISVIFSIIGITWGACFGLGGLIFGHTDETFIPGTICLIGIGIIFGIITFICWEFVKKCDGTSQYQLELAKVIKEKEEEQKHKYVTLKSGKRVQIY